MIKKAFFIAFVLFALSLIFSVSMLLFDSNRLQKRNVHSGSKAVHIFNYGWHTGLVIAVEDIPENYLPYFAMLKQHRFVEISWGDAKFYQYRRPGINWFLALRALLVPTSSVLHMVGFDMPVDHFYNWSRFYTIFLNDQEFRDLLTYISSYFETDENHKFVIVDRGLYGDSWFLKSKHKYVFPNTCNVWTARALKAAHLPLTPVIYQYSSFLIKVLERYSKKQAQHKNVRFVINGQF
ncbi:MAG: DUF2459 domain-containing protein [Caldisericaceae bacterium]|nr:DUF2459 domain-containing protein [Caldisericaceae bacterium]